MEKDPDELRAVAIGREDGAKHVWNIHPRQAEALAAGENRCEHDRAGKSTE